MQRRQTERDLNEELQFHLEMQTQHNIDQGMSPTIARRAARRSFGGVDQAKEICRDAWGLRLWHDFSRDVRYAFKSLVRSPGFTFIAVLTLGLGIGVNAVMFSFVRDTVLRPFLRDQEHHLTAIYNSRAGADRDYRHFSYAEYEVLRQSTDVFAEVAASFYSTEAVGLKDDLQRRFISVVEGNFFKLIGTAPWQGRFFNADESRPDAAIPVAVANYNFWDRLGRPEHFVGSTIRVNQRDYTVIGITPPGFVGLHVSVGPEVWLPMGEAHTILEESVLTPTAHPFDLVARFAEGLSPAGVTMRLTAVDERINAIANPDQDGPRRLVLTPPSRTDLGSSRPSEDGLLNVFALLSMGLATAVLIVACLNLANMVLARGAARQKEIAIRLSLGASRGRIIRQLTTEGFVLSLLGGAAGLLLSVWADQGIYEIAQRTFATSSFTLSVSPLIDYPLLAALFAFCLLATLASSLGPALRITRPNLIDDLKQLSAAARGSRWARAFTLGNTLVIAQIALSLALLFSAALFVRSSWNARTLEVGFETSNQLVANLDYRSTDMSPAMIARRQRALLDHFAPLVTEGEVALASNVPYNFELRFQAVIPVERGAEVATGEAKSQHQFAGSTAVSEDYFSALGITLLRGRTFTVAEGSHAEGPLVAIIDERVARTLFGDAPAVGRRIYWGENDAAKGDPVQAREIVGVVRSPRDEVFQDEPPPRIYLPLGQVPSANIYLHLGTTEPVRRVDTIRRELRTHAPDVPVLFVRPLATFVQNNVNSLLIELAAIIFGLFGAIALLLAVVGVYGVKSHAVARRTREIGIRMALGARPQSVMALILRQGLNQTLIGLTLGVGLSLGARHLLASMIYRAGTGSGFALIGSAGLLATAVLIACWIPARRATKVDPSSTLRSE